MSPLVTRVALIAVLALTCVATTDAQQQEAQPTRDVLTPLTVHVVLSRFQGEKKVSSLPYALAINANGGRASLRMGANVPIETMMFGPENKAAPSSFTYRDVGIAIDCGAGSLDNDRYSIQLTVEDSSVYGGLSAASKSPDHPTFRTFKSNNSFVLRDGQTAQFTMATDKLTGEVIKGEVSLTVGK
jgi:hypothetical protein